MLEQILLLARNPSSFKHNMLKKCMYACLLYRVVLESVLESSYAHSDLRYQTSLTLCLMLASVCDNRTTFKFAEMGHGAIN